jgi:molybdopterin-guanine dinucleotide biosynthesis protein A
LIEGEKNIQRLKEKVGRLTSEILLVTNDQDTFSFLELPMIEDKKKGQGPLAGIQAGLSKSKNSWNLIVACDLPYFDERVVSVLVKKAISHPKAQAIIPHIHGREHPLYALYHQSAEGVVAKNLEQGTRRIRDALCHLDVEAITEDDLIGAKMTKNDIEKAFFNMNRPEDYDWVISQKTSDEMRRRDDGFFSCAIGNEND